MVYHSFFLLSFSSSRVLRRGTGNSRRDVWAWGPVMAVFSGSGGGADWWLVGEEWLGR